MAEHDFTWSDLAAIRRTIAKGELVVSFADRQARYRDLDELLRAESRIAAALGTVPRTTIVVAKRG